MSSSGVTHHDNMAIAGTLAVTGNITQGADEDGVDVTWYGDTSGAYLNWDASDDRLEGIGNAKILIGESTTGVTTAGGTTMVYGMARHKTNALTGDLNGVRGDARVVDIASPNGSCNGGYFLAGNSSGGYNLGNARGIYCGVVNKTAVAASVTWTNARGLEINMDLDQGSSGHTTTITNAYGIYAVWNLPTAGTYTTVTNGYGILMRNEAVGGTGQQLDYGFKLEGLNQSGGIVAWDYGIYMSEVVRPLYAAATFSGSTSKNLMELAVTDSGTPSTGYTRGLYIGWTNTGNRTGDAEINGIGVDLTLDGDVVYAYGASFYAVHSGNPTLDFVAPISIYVDDLGTACGNMVGIDIGLAGGSNSPSGRHAFMRFRNHSSGAVPDAIFLIEGNGGADYLMSIDTAAGIVTAGAVSGSQSHKLNIKINSVDYFIPLNTA
jgi:hypothetical protein